MFDPGENPTWASGTRVDSDCQELNDVNGTVLAVGYTYGEELACCKEPCEASIDGLPGGISDVESVDPPWRFTVGEMSLESQVLTCRASALGQHCFPMEETSSSQKLTTMNVGTRHVFDPGEEPQHIVMNLTESESSSIGAECWLRHLEEDCCQDQQLGTATLRDGLRRQGGRRCADERKPILLRR